MKKIETIKEILWEYTEHIVDSNRKDPLDEFTDAIQKIAEMISEDIPKHEGYPNSLFEESVRDYLDDWIAEKGNIDIS